MKKNFKRTLAKVMAVALTVSMLGVSTNDADAAKKIKLSSKSISVVKGKTKKVTIKNVKAKKVKKLTVKSANKKIATVKKSGKTAIKVTGKKAGKSTKVTVKVTVKGKKKATKLTLKVKVTKATAVKTAAPATSATPAASAAASATPAASTDPSATPAASTNPSADPDATPEATPEATEPPQPEPPTTEAKELPEVNLRRDNVPAWVTKGGYCTALFNTDDTVSYSSQGWSAAGSCYNNGIAWYIDSAKKGKIDMSAYSEVALTIKTDAEVKFMTWGGSTDPESFWDKNDTWGNVKETIENADGSKTLVYDLETVFGSATKVKKAIAVGFTLKSDLNGDDQAFSERTATVYSIKFIKGSGSSENESGSNESGSNEKPLVLEGTALGASADFTYVPHGFAQWASMGVFEIDKSKISAGSTIVLTYTAKEGDADVKDSQGFNVGLKTGSKYNSPAILDVYGRKGGTISIPITSEHLAKVGDSDKIYMHVSTDSAGFKGTFTYTSIKVGNDDLVSPLPKSITYEERGMGQYAATAKVSLPADIDFKKYSKCKIEFTASNPTFEFHGIVGHKVGGAEVTDPKYGVNSTGLFEVPLNNVKAAKGTDPYVVINTGKAGYEGSVKITKITFVPVESK